MRIDLHKPKIDRMADRDQSACQLRSFGICFQIERFFRVVVVNQKWVKP